MKNIFIIAICLIAILPNAFGQKNCSKKIHTVKDEFKHEEHVNSDVIMLIDKSGRNLINALANTGDNVHDWYLSFNFLEQRNTYILAFTHYSYAKISTKLNYVYLKFSDDSIIELTNPLTTDQIEDGPSTGYTNSFFKISENGLKSLLNKNLEKIKVSFYIQPREPIYETTISIKKSTEIKDLATCFYEIAPKLKIPLSTLSDFPSYFPIDTTSHKVDYKGVSTIENKNKKKLFLNAKEWFAKNFSSLNHGNALTNETFNAGITFEDTTRGKIIGTGIIDVHYKTKDGSDVSGGIVGYSITLMVKDNKYKYEITEFNHKGYKFTGTHDLGLIEEWAKDKNRLFPKLSQIQSYWDQVNNKILSLIDLLNTSMKQENNDDKW